MTVRTNRIYILLMFLLLPLQKSTGSNDPVFIQEYHRGYHIGSSEATNDVRTILTDRRNRIWAGTKGGLFMLDGENGTWKPMLDTTDQGPVNDMFEDKSGNIWIATWNGLFRTNNLKAEKIKTINSPISVVSEIKNGIMAAGPEGVWELHGKHWTQKEIKTSRALRCLLNDCNGGYYLGTGKGLYHQQDGKLRLYQDMEQLLSDDVYGLDFSKKGKLWIGGLGGVTIYDPKTDQRIRSITPKEGLSSIWVRCIASAPDGTMWIGTDLGITRFFNDSSSLRHSQRWLMDDHVRDIAFDNDGNAWIATAGGVSVIKKRPITLAQKADHYYRILKTRHIREPWLVEKCRFRIPGDTTTWEPMDDDNDGQYTAMYLAMESYRYAVTGDPDARKNAVNAFHALRFLQTVTGTDGFVARTVIPVTWTRMADPNETITNRMWAEREVRNPRDKRVENHWRKSKDGKWLWKGDTSSDEITGHMYSYTLFYELIAGKDPQLAEEVSHHVQKIVDNIIEGGYLLKDLDGTHTKWGVWAPEYLNHDPDWASERGINSLEILSYLKLAWHVSGEKKYQEAYLTLFHRYHYGQNVLEAKTVRPAWRTFIDDELAALAFPALMLYEQDPEIRDIYLTSLNNWQEACKEDDSPFYDYTIDAFSEKRDNLKRALLFLQDNPLDLIRWRVDNTHREDLILTHHPILEDIETSRLVPPSERGIMRWDKNPWAAIRGDGGRTESSGVYWLLPYWMGRYYGFIGK